MTLKKFALALISIFTTVFSYTEDFQIVFPKTVYVGDTVEIRYIFQTSDERLSRSFPENSGRLELAKDYPLFEAQKNAFELKDIFIEKTGSSFALSIKLLPWKSGYLTVPAFDLNSLISFSKKQNSYGNSLAINLKPIPVNSLLEKNGSNSFMPQSAPLVMPGTTLMLVITGIFYLILVSAIIFLLIRIPAISTFLEMYLSRLSLKKHSRLAIRKIEKLLRTSAESKSDSDFAMELQKILRDFLKKRFAFDFDSTPTSGIYDVFCGIMGGELSEKESKPVEKLVEIFFRTDYIRYSGKAAFERDERASIAQNSIAFIFDVSTDFEDDGREEENC